jgi:hypothetical protein
LTTLGTKKSGGKKSRPVTFTKNNVVVLGLSPKIIKTRVQEKTYERVSMSTYVERLKTKVEESVSREMRCNETFVLL